jgi:hypothetical protein
MIKRYIEKIWFKVIFSRHKFNISEKRDITKPKGNLILYFNVILKSCLVCMNFERLFKSLAVKLKAKPETYCSTNHSKCKFQRETD